MGIMVYSLFWGATQDLYHQPYVRVLLRDLEVSFGLRGVGPKLETLNPKP